MMLSYRFDDSSFVEGQVSPFALFGLASPLGVEPLRFGSPGLMMDDGGDFDDDFDDFDDDFDEDGVEDFDELEDEEEEDDDDDFDGLDDDFDDDFDDDDDF